MRKVALILAAGVGFILGSRSGRQPYEKLEQQIRKLRGNPHVEDTVDAIKDKVVEQKDEVVGKVASKAHSSDSPSSNEPPWPTTAAAV